MLLKMELVLAFHLVCDFHSCLFCPAVTFFPDHGYSIPISSADGASSTIKASWTRGLAVHPVATAVTFVALLLSFSTHITMTLLASIVSFLAAALTLIAFAIDIALFVLVRHAMNNLNIGANTDTAPGEHGILLCRHRCRFFPWCRVLFIFSWKHVT